MSADEGLFEALAHAEAGYCLGPVTVRQDPAGGKSVVFHTTWQRPGGTSRDHAQIRDWATRFPGCGFHAPCGPNGIVVVDLDGEDGVQNWRRLDGPRSPMTVMTRSGGRHVYFRAPAVPIRNSAGVIAPHIDVRGDGGTVFVSGTVVHGSDARYVATRILAPYELPQLTDEWATRLRNAGPTAKGRRARVHGLRPPSRERAQGPVRLSHTPEWIEAKARAELRSLGRIPRADFTERLHAAALAGYRAVIAGAFDELEVELALTDAIHRAGRTPVTSADLDAIKRALRDAAAQPWEVTA